MHGQLSPSWWCQRPACSTLSLSDPKSAQIWSHWPLWPGRGFTDERRRAGGGKSLFCGSQSHCKREDCPVSWGDKDRWSRKDGLEPEGEAFVVQCSLHCPVSVQGTSAQPRDSPQFTQFIYNFTPRFTSRLIQLVPSEMKPITKGWRSSCSPHPPPLAEDLSLGNITPWWWQP